MNGRQRGVTALKKGGDPGYDLRFEIGTGELAPDARFDPHGHVVVINLTGVLQGQAGG